MTTSPQVSLFSRDTRLDPYPVYAQLRDEAPIYREPVMGTFVLTRFDDVYNALKDHGTFSSARGISPGMQSGTNALMTSLITSDPPRHTRLRGLVNRAFTPRVLANLEPWLEGLVDELVDGFPADGDVDVVPALTVPLPVSAIARVLGIPEEDGERFKEWSDAVVGATDGGMSDSGRDKVREMMMYFAAIIAGRKAEPRDDLVSTIAFAEVDGERLTDFEMLGFCLLLLIAGNETTTNLLGNTLQVFARRPDLWEALRKDPGLVPAAVEEGLRYDSPVQVFFRTTTREVELHGEVLPENASVAVAYASANRDPREFDGADEFRLDRELSRHVAFGHGVHYCLGAPLARLEAKIALTALSRRFASVAPGDQEGVRISSAILRGFHSLPLRFER